MHKSFYYIIVSFFIVLSFSSCNKLDNRCIKSVGEEKEKVIMLPQFSVLNINSFFDVILVQDTINYIKFSGGKNLLNYVNADVSQNSLSITDNNSCRWTRDYKKQKIKAELHFVKLDSIIAYRECNIRSLDTIKNDIFLIRFISSHLATLDITVDVKEMYLKINPSSGDYYVKGRCSFNYIYSIGLSYVHTEGLKCDSALVYSYESGDIYVAPIQKLRVLFYNYGNVYYCTSPQEIIETRTNAAKGKLIKIEG